jgi:hypothetical protein
MDLPYDGEPPSQRHSKTSQDAAASIKSKVGNLHRVILAWLDRHPDGASDERMAADLDMVQNTFRPRRRELQLMGYVMDSGRTELTYSGRGAVVWIRDKTTPLQDPPA